MDQIVGKIKRIIYKNDTNNYVIAILKITDSKGIKDVKNYINIAGIINECNIDLEFIFNGACSYNKKYNNYQFDFNSYEVLMPTENDQIIDFLTSSFIKGCGKKTAKLLVDTFKENTLEAIKDINNLLSIKGISEKKALQLSSQINDFDNAKLITEKLLAMGFSVSEAYKLVNNYCNINEIIESDIYKFREYVPFAKLDSIYLLTHNRDDKLRMYYLIIETLNFYSFSNGDVYFEIKDILSLVNMKYNVSIDPDIFDEILDNLQKDNEIVIKGNFVFIKELYDSEIVISYKLKKILNQNNNKMFNLEEAINDLEIKNNIEYDINQRKAITEALSNNISIISGGPGTGKTTILKAIVSLYQMNYDLSHERLMSEVALLAPTGRASKKMSQATKLPAYTIHRYLKWNKESDSFLYDELNLKDEKLIIIDEVSMVDLKLFASLLKALKSNVKLILVGDAYQLPSVSPGLILNNMIDSELFNFIPLTKIYRQSENSYIPYLAQNIKNQDIEEDFLNKKDDYNFIKCDSNQILSSISSIVKSALAKGIDDKNMQILAPLYKGVNGIDNINYIIRDIYNPRTYKKNEIVYNDITYREGDKVIYLINDSDNNISNGDIGYITSIVKTEKKVYVTVLIDDTSLEIEKKNLLHLKHAYAISIHKSQGSEFEHVILPITNEYSHMMYNKLLYTGVSRAKSSLIIVGNPNTFIKGVMNNYATKRNTTLTENLKSIIIDI